MSSLTGSNHNPRRVDDMMASNAAFLVTLCLSGFWWLGSSLAASQGPSILDPAVERMRAYVVDYEKSLSAVVAEERYESWIELSRNDASGSTGRVRERSSSLLGPSKRLLVSDFLMIRWPGETAWLGFRDVFSVDGAPVRDRQDRLLKLFTDGSKDPLVRAGKIAEESTRYNIGSVQRNINVPTQVLDFLHPRYAPRFSFRTGNAESVNGRKVLRIQFEERAEPYLIQTPAGAGVRSRGVVWTDPTDGTIVQTQLDLTISEARTQLRSQITSLFRLDSELAIHVPTELRELHEQFDSSRVGDAVRTHGRAHFSRFRRFTAETRENIQSPGLP